MTTELVIEAIRNDQNLNTPNNLKFPCGICNKNVLTNQKVIQCDSCDLWCHIKCDGTSIETYNKLMLSEEDSLFVMYSKVSSFQLYFYFVMILKFKI